METKQVYSLVNEVVAQATGQKNLAAVDAATLVTMGNVILSSTNNVEAFMNTLVQRIALTIMGWRKYRNKLNDYALTDFQWGAIVQKVRVHIPEFQADESYNLENGKSVDPWVINKPEAEQKLFAIRTPYSVPITISRVLLKEAFQGPELMSRFISYVTAQIRNGIELSLENLCRVAISNMVASTAHEVKLVTEYNAESGESITPANAMLNSKFMAWAIGIINQYRDYLADMSVLFNDGSIETFTPYSDQRFLIHSNFQRQLETTVQYAAFHDTIVSAKGKYNTVTFWQAQQDRMSIQLQPAAGGEAVTIENLVGIIHDRDAVGTFQREEDVLTTPVNARARYYNTFYHLKQLWFNDTSENFVYFTLS